MEETIATDVRSNVPIVSACVTALCVFEQVLRFPLQAALSRYKTQCEWNALSRRGMYVVQNNTVLYVINTRQVPVHESSQTYVGKNENDLREHFVTPTSPQEGYLPHPNMAEPQQQQPSPSPEPSPTSSSASLRSSSYSNNNSEHGGGGDASRNTYADIMRAREALARQAVSFGGGGFAGPPSGGALV